MRENVDRRKRDRLLWSKNNGEKRMESSLNTWTEWCLDFWYWRRVVKEKILKILLFLIEPGKGEKMQGSRPVLPLYWLPCDLTPFSYFFLSILFSSFLSSLTHRTSSHWFQQNFLPSCPESLFSHHTFSDLPSILFFPSSPVLVKFRKEER